MILEKMKAYTTEKTQENIKDFIKKYGTNITINFQNNDVELTIKKNYYYNKFEYYSIQTKEILQIPVALYAFKINTAIMTNKGIPDYGTAEIDNIQKREDLGIISGTYAVELAIKLLTLFNYKSVILTDASSIECMTTGQYTSLALYKILERGTTFYEKFGFSPYYSPDIDQPYLRLLYESEKDVIKDYKKKINYMRNYPTKRLINKFTKLKKLFIKIINNSLYDKTTIKIVDFNNHFQKMLIEYPKEQNMDYIFGKLKEITEILLILEQTRKTNLSRDLLSIDCGAYQYILNFLTETQNINYIKVNKQMISLEELEPMIFLTLLRRDIIYKKKIR